MCYLIESAQLTNEDIKIQIMEVMFAGHSARKRPSTDLKPGRLCGD